MTDEEINEAIAEVCGWECLAPDVWHNGIVGYSKDTHGIVRSRIPNYCADLNAMHEAEQEQWRKNHSSRYDFVYELGKILMPTIGYRAEAVDLLDATARQHAEAFLKTIGKWKETE